MKFSTGLRLFIAGAFIVPAFLASAQDKMLTMEDAFLKSSLIPANLSGLSWRSGNTYTFTAGEFLIQGKATESKRDTILNLTQLNTALNAVKADSAKRFPNFTWLGDSVFYYNTGKKFVFYNINNKKARVQNSFQAGAANFDFEKEKRNTAFTVENNLFIALAIGETVQVTKDDNKGIVNGQSVHRNEFGIHGGTFWSPKGNFLAFYRMDESMVTDYPLMNINTRPADDKKIKYPMAGMKSHHVTLGIFDLATRKTIFIKTGEPAEQYLTNISWGPDEKQVYIKVLNRDQNHMKLNRYNASTGEFEKTLYEEKHDKYVEPLHPLYFFKKNPKEFLVLSQRDGYRHIYWYNTDGKLIRQLTKGNWIITDFFGMDADERNIFFSATDPVPTEQNIYVKNLMDRKTTRLSAERGLHTAIISPDGQYVIDRYSSTTIPRRIDVIDNKGKVTQTLLKADNPIKDYKLGETKLFTIKAADNTTDLHCRIITPPNMEPGKKYPVVVYVYGGPHAQMVTNSWLGGSNLWMQYMAQQGYIMFTVDNRGSNNRGFEFENATHRQLGTVEMEDQLKGVEYLKSLPYVDAERLGVHGWSYGGFMTTSLMSRKPGTFKAGVAGGPVIDWKYYEIMYTERYMDSPEQNKEGYDKNNLLNYVKDLQGKLLMIHGTVDDVVVWQHSLMYVKKCVDEGKLLDYFVYPGHPHNVHGKDRVHLYKKVTEYFNDFLK